MLSVLLSSPHPLDAVLGAPGGLVPNLLAVVVVLTVVGIAWVAVWSRDPIRRCAAAAVLDRLLTALERLAVPPRPES